MTKFQSIKALCITCNLLIFNLIIFSIGHAQQTNNLQVIWEMTAPPNHSDFGSLITSGDLNGDGFSDIVVRGDSYVVIGHVTYVVSSHAFIFYGGPNFDTIPDKIINNTEGFGYAIHTCDVNDDGFDDLVLGQQHINQISIYLGGDPMDTVCDFVIRGPHTGAVFGVGISSGDVNGDGDEDLIVGAYGTFIYPVCELAGRVYIYFGGPNFDTIPDVILNGGHNNDQEAFGRTVSGTGDVNNDGFDDVIIGAMNYGYNHGRVYIYYGGNPMNTVYDVAIIGEEVGQSIGEFSVDFVKNYQTFDYAVFGTPLWGPTSPQGNNPGKVYILYGGNPMDSIPDVWMVGRTTESNLGMKAYSAGRCNNDFYDEVIAGAPVEYAGTGTSYLWLGGSNIDTIPDAWLKGTQSVIGIGWNVASAGDVDGDGKDEVIVSNYAGGPKRVWVCKYTGLGTEEIATHSLAMTNIKIIPNPASSVVRVRCPLSLKEMKIYDISGKLVKTLDKVDSRQNTEYRELRWDLRCENNRRVANGIYFVEITAENEQKEIRKVIITK